MNRSRGEGQWRFSLALYARPGVAEALLALQDRAGRDVNLMLFALWLGAVDDIALDPAALAAAEAAIAPLKAVVSPLRRLRQGLKNTPDLGLHSIRRRVGALELVVEREVLQRLAEQPVGRPAGATDRLAVAAANLALYLGPEAASPEAAAVRRALAALARAG